MSALQERIYGSLALAGMGDALGAPTEQWTIEEIATQYGGLVSDFRTPPPDCFAGANGGLRGEVTDDASQLYYLARALGESAGRLDAAGWLACLLDWAATSPKASFMGPSTAVVVRALRDGTDPAKVGTIGESSRKLTTLGITNGAAMRVAPAGLVHPGDLMAACDQALVTCLPTHDTDIAISAACAVAAAVSVAVVSTELTDVIDAALEGASRGEELAARHARRVPGPRFLSRLRAALGIAERAANDRAFLCDIDEHIGCSVLAVESVAAAIAIVAYARAHAWRTVSIAASIGNDTDSIATMAGSIVGAMVGRQGLPAGPLAAFLAANPTFDLDRLAGQLTAVAHRG